MSEKCGDHAVKLDIAGTPYRLFPIVHVSNLKLVRVFPERPTGGLNVDEATRSDLDEALVPEDSWRGVILTQANLKWIRLSMCDRDGTLDMAEYTSSIW